MVIYVLKCVTNSLVTRVPSWLRLKVNGEKCVVCVHGACVHGACVHGACVHGACVHGACVHGACVHGACVHIIEE